MSNISMPRSGYACLHRFILPDGTLDRVRPLIERGDQFSWIGSKGNPTGSQRLRRCTFHGVSAKLVDVLMPDEPPSAGELCLEIGRKSGRYDGAERTQLVFRRWSAARGTPLPYGTLTLAEEDDVVEASGVTEGTDKPVAARQLVACALWRPRRVDYPVTAHRAEPKAVQLSGGSWVEAWPKLRTLVVGDPEELKAIIIWHWKRYYQGCVRHEDMDSLIAEFRDTLMADEWQSATLHECNRLASRILYRSAVQSGWRKLTKRERIRLGFSVQWVTEKHRIKRASEMGLLPYGTTTGAGQYTHEAAAGHAMREELVTSYGVTSVEG